MAATPPRIRNVDEHVFLSWRSNIDHPTRMAEPGYHETVDLLMRMALRPKRPFLLRNVGRA